MNLPARTAIGRAIKGAALVVALVAVASCAGHAAGAYRQVPLAIGVDSGPGTTMFIGTGYHIVKPRGQGWFTKADFLRRQEEMKNHARSMGMPDHAISSSHDAVVKRTMSMDLFMAASLDRYSFARLGVVCDKDAVLNIQAGAFRLKLRTAAGDTLTVVDAGILWRMDKDHGHSYLDTQRGMGRCTWDLQKPDYSERANVLYLRLPRSCDGASVERIAVDSTKLSMEME